MNNAWSKPTKYIAGVALVLLVIYLINLARPVIPLLVVAGLIAVLVRPIIRWLHFRARFPRGLAVGVTYLGVLIIVPLALLLTIPAIIDAVQYVLDLDYGSIIEGGIEWLRTTLISIRDARLILPALDTYVDQMIDAVLLELDQAEPAGPAAAPSVPTIISSLTDALTFTFGAAADVVGAVFSSLALLIFLLLASIHMSLSAHTYLDAFMRAVPTAYQAEIAILLTRIGRMWNAFFRGQLTLMIVIGVTTWLGLTILGVPGAVYLGIIAGLLEIIPNLGPVIAAIPAVIVALLQGSSYLPVNSAVFALIVVLLYVLIQQLENNFIVPRVLGGAVELPALVVMTGVLVGASAAGILGALLATPVIATGREVIRYVYHKILGEDPFPPGDAEPEPAQTPTMDLRQILARWSQRLTTVRFPWSSRPVDRPPDRLPERSPDSKSTPDKP